MDSAALRWKRIDYVGFELDIFYAWGIRNSFFEIPRGERRKIWAAGNATENFRRVGFLFFRFMNIAE